MRLIMAVLVLAACGGSDDSLDAPDDCGSDELHAIYGSGEDSLTVTTHVFVNKISDDPGALAIGMPGSDYVYLEFDKLVPNGGTVDARGSIQLTTSGLDVGNCETGGFVSQLFVGGDSLYRFELSNLAMAPYCSGESFAGSVSGCYQGGQ
jgi:hypothetical protein